MAKQKINSRQNQPSIMKLSANSNTAASTVPAGIALNVTQLALGSGLTKSGNGILIGSGVNYVRASACITFESFSNTGTYAFSYLRKNTEQMAQALCPSTAGFAFHSLSATFAVAPGDVINISGDVGSGTATFSGSTRPIHLTVEVIA